MLDRLGLPRPRIATTLYGAIALTLVVVFGLAATAIQVASRTEDTVTWVQRDALQDGLLSLDLEAALEQQRQLIARAHASQAAGATSIELAAASYGQLSGQIAALLERMGHKPNRKLADRLASLERRGKASLQSAHSRSTEEARAAAEAFDTLALELQASLAADRRLRARSAEEALAEVAASSRRLIAWMCAAAALTGLVIGPLGLLLLRRMLARLQGVGSALLRLARNDTSLEIPSLTHPDEVGQLARSVAVFKAKSIELLQKKGELERVNLQLDAALNNMPLGLSMFDAQERLLVCNREFARMYALPPELTKPGVVHCALWDYRERNGARHHPSGGGIFAPQGGHPDSMTIELDDERIISVTTQPLKGGGWVALDEDITQRRRQEREITHLARHDALTSLANRALFREKLQQAQLRIGRGQGFAVLCLDLDRFKSINDTLGHPVGDALLKQVSARLVGCVRQGDVVARLGGDEFAIIQTNVRDPEATEALAARIVDNVSQPYDIGGQRIDISTSIGMTMAPRDGEDADQLMKNADLALYRAKADGRRGYSFFRPAMGEHIQARHRLESDLRTAFEEEQLALFYQPIVSLGTRKVVGLEALMRWRHPKRGLVPPMEFIGLAEEIGLISELGAWALQKACGHAVRWSSPIKVAINLSPLQIRRDLIEMVLQALAASGLPPDRLELEITESVLLQDSQNTMATLHQLRQLGVRIAMDDFGTGFGSLSYLRSFPFDKIKIDRAFIADMDRSHEARAIVDTIVRLGQSLDMATVAEGIETFEQLRHVCAAGCTHAQGYYFSQPVAASEIERVLAQTFEHARDAA
jgi:diguanylate cyclase (GGDEF)-like protein